MGTRTKNFGSGNREGHDSSEFYARFAAPNITDSETVNRDARFLSELGAAKCLLGDARDMSQVADNSVSLVATSPPYFVGKVYEIDLAEDGVKPASYVEYLQMLSAVFAECHRVLEPGGRIAVNVANLGRKPYRSLSADVIGILEDLGFLLRGEIVWEKSKTSSGSCAWGSFAKASNPVIRDMTERVVIASKGRFDRALSSKQREKLGLPFESTLSNDEFMDATTDVWQIDAESAKRVGHPAPFPVALPEKLINLFTYLDDVVLDPFCGAGSTLIAAARNGRVGVGFDIEAEYVRLANDRIAQELDTEKQSSDSYRHGVDQAAKLSDIAEHHLTSLGYELDSSSKKTKVPGNRFDWLASRTGEPDRLVLVAGGFLISQPGITSTDEALKVTALAALAAHPEPVLVVTAAMASPKSQASKVLKLAEENGLIELLALS